MDLEAMHVIALPAMQGNRGLRQGLDGLFGIHAKIGVAFFRIRVTLCGFFPGGGNEGHVCQIMMMFMLNGLTGP